MKYLFLIVFFSLATLPTTVNAQDDAIAKPSLKTAFIGNRNYLIRDQWQDIPLDTVKREDMNSRNYGGKLFPMLANNSRTIKEKRLSIANQKMEIWMDLDNSGETIWKLQSVELNVLDRYEIDPKAVESGQWRRFRSRLNQFSPTLLLSNEATDKIVVRPTRAVLVYPNGTGSDNRFSVSVSNDPDQPLQNVIYRYSLQFNLVDTRDTSTKISITADKDYFLGFLE